MKHIIVPSEYLIESSFARLKSNTLNPANFQTPRDEYSERVQVIKKNYMPAPRNGVFGVMATTSTEGKRYSTKMYFSGVNYLDDDEDGNAFTFMAPDGQDYLIEPIDYDGDDVRVACGCLDFYYRFSVWNYSDGSLHGQPPPPYIKKTDTHGPVNPNRVPGVCKHLLALSDELADDGLYG